MMRYIIAIVCWWSVVYLSIAFVSWDIQWAALIPESHYVERVLLLMGVGVTTIALVVLVKIWQSQI